MSNILKTAEYEYLRKQLKNVMIELQSIAEYHHGRHAPDKAENALKNMRAIANYAGFVENEIERMKNEIERIKNENWTDEEPAEDKTKTCFDKEAIRAQSIAKAMSDFPNLYHGTHVAQ